MKAGITNYKSLRAIEVEFGKLTTLVGRNSSGKSNLLEALHLFFNEFDPAPQRDVTGVPEYLWYNRDTQNPIEFVITVKLGKREYNQIFSEELSATVGVAFKEGNLTICREVAFKPPNTATWRTTYVALDDVPIIENGNLVSRPVEPPTTPEKEEETASKGKAKAATSATPKATELDMLNKIVTNISQKLKGNFKLILTTRNYMGALPQLGERPSHMLPDIQKEIITTHESDKIGDLQTWNKIENDINEIQSLSRLNVRGGELRTRIGIIPFPVSYLGGGDQEILALAFLLRKERADIFAIEEPETHLHPNLSRKFLNILEDASKVKQLIIATHSPIFMDIVNLDNSWIFRADNGETKVYRIQSAEDLKTVNYELGIRPSDVFFADKILFVEGPIDKTVYRIWADKIRIDLKSPIISVIPLRGKSKGKRHLQAWIEVTRNIPVAVSMILDKDAKSQADKLVESGLITRRQISVLNKGAIEDYYDRDVLTSVMKERYGAEFPENILKPSQSRGLIKFLKTKHRDWRTFCRAKAEIGEKVANQMSKDQIHDDVRRALERTEEHLELS